MENDMSPINMAKMHPDTYMHSNSLITRKYSIAKDNKKQYYYGVSS